MRIEGESPTPRPSRCLESSVRDKQDPSVSPSRCFPQTSGGDASSSPTGLGKTKADGQVQMARVSADATIAQQTVSGLVTLVVALLSSLGLGFIARTIHQAYRDKLKAQNARQAIEHLALNGGSMTLDTGHSFTIRPKYEVMPIGIEPPQVQTNFTVAEKEKVEIPQVSRTPRISR